MAAAAFAGLEEQKLGPVEYQFNKRVVFGPSVISRTSQTERTQLAAFELQDVCHDAVLMGSSFAEDPAIQAAVISHHKKNPNVQAMMSSYGIETDCVEMSEIKNQAKELQVELEWQQDLNQDMITHSERLAEERVQLKARVQTLEQENDRLRSALERIQPDTPRIVVDDGVVAVLNEPAQLPRRQRARGPRHEARAGEAEQRGSPNLRAEGHTGAAIVMQMALAFAAVVIALVVAKKMPTGIKASAFVGAVLTAFGAYRQ